MATTDSKDIAAMRAWAAEQAEKHAPPAAPASAEQQARDLLDRMDVDGAQKMTVRDEFAKVALQAALAGARIPREDWRSAMPTIADFAYMMADAMMAARDRVA